VNAVDQQPVAAQRSSLIKRIVFAISLVVLTFGSLITFPAYLHWMALVWVALSLIALTKQQPM
jgi:hypothetical protein